MASAEKMTKYCGHGPIPDEIHHAARLLWESSIDMTLAEVGAEFNVAYTTLKGWSSKEKWEKACKVHRGQVIPAPRRALKIVRREMAASGGEPIDPARMRLLARVEYNRQRDARARNMDVLQNNLAIQMYKAAMADPSKVPPYQTDMQIARLKVAMDAISKIHKLQSQLWRMGEGEPPSMADTTLIEGSYTPR